MISGMRCHYKPEPKRAKDYDTLDAQVKELQDERSRLYEDMDLSDEDLDAMTATITAEIEDLIGRMWM